jgi:VWFA-related protein
MEPWRGAYRLGPMSLRSFLALALVFSAAAQDSTFSIDVKVVTIYATVLDPKGRTVRDLTKEDFTIEEDGKPQTIRYFSREFSVPVIMGLLVDTCMWQLRIIEPEKTASYAFLDNVLGDSDKAVVLHFDKVVELTQNLTNSREKLGAAVADLKTVPVPRIPNRTEGGCHFFEGLQKASEVMKEQTGRKAFILLSAGMDRGSKISGGSTIELAQRSDVIVYSIPFQGPHWPASNAAGELYRNHGREFLQRLARETGGGYFPVTTDKPIDKIYAQIEEELRAQYVIGYIPDQSKPSRGYRKLNLTANRRDVTVHSREGYYAK